MEAIGSRCPDLVLRRSQTLRFVSGRVVDREGKGVAGASVFQSGDAPRRTSTTTDAEGRFRLAGVPSGEALVFAEKAGFRFGGAIVKPGDARVDVRLARVEEPPRSMPKSLPSPLTRAEERAMARELLAPLIDAARPGSLGFDGRLGPADSGVAVDPDRVLEMIENRVLTEPASALRQIALAQLESDPAAAVATIEADLNPASRRGFPRDRRRDAGIRSRASHRADRPRAGRGPSRRRQGGRSSELLGHVADCWLDLDAVDRATPIIREGQAIVATMPQDRYSFGVEEFADVLAVIDLAAARIDLRAEGPDEHRPDRSRDDQSPPRGGRRPARGDRPGRGRAAGPRRCAELPGQLVAQDYVLRICRRMARADLPRARRILDTIDDPTGPASFPKPVLGALRPRPHGFRAVGNRPGRGAGTAGRGIRPAPQGRERAGRQGHPPARLLRDGRALTDGRAARARPARGATLAGRGLPRVACRAAGHERGPGRA